MRQLIVAVAVMLLAVAWPVFAQEETAPSAVEWLARGDKSYENFDNKGALEAYRRATLADSTNCEAWWKLARAYVDVGEQADKTQRRQYYSLGEKAARKAVGLCPNNADAHFELAVAVGRVALDVGGKTKVELSKEVKAEGEKALELDPEHDGALHLLGRWHREVANLSGVLKAFAKVLYGGLPPASNEQAIAYFKKAIAVKPEHINHHLELARTYRMVNNWAAAKEHYEKVLALPVSDADDPTYKEEAKIELQEVEKKLH
ncbi:MAG: hypothetical protein ONB30_00650 [candidate division KSB1 bacterium]|nr:hypothetical protein [candidate division KSB1 bacterium]MDZ7293903.1 hypothetical protein [candidate division KSB1 bacterium]MDZ7337026.1 hypothetical protein [candidate division KSB1 bacterium]MDZ7378010.1 hypothetical protein [candidate division KSB1 bacterium]MDZ7384697.1 hypothetical protein [candidate division KSB1 bacterium]